MFVHLQKHCRDLVQASPQALVSTRNDLFCVRKAPGASDQAYRQVN